MAQYFHFSYKLGGSDEYPEFHVEKTVNTLPLAPVLKYVSSLREALFPLVCAFEPYSPVRSLVRSFGK